MAQGQESDRALRFDKAMRDAESAPLSSKPSPLIETARSLARLDSEKAAVESLLRRRAANLQAEQAKREKAVIPRLDEIGKKVAQVEKQADSLGSAAAAADEAAVFGPTADAQQSLADLGPDLDLAGDEAQNRARDLSKRLEAIRGRLDRRHLEVQLEEAITRAVAYHPENRGFPSANELAAALQAFAKSFPDLPRSRAISDTLKEQSLWESVAAWDKLSDRWKGSQPALSPQEARVRAEQCGQFLVQHPGSPDIDRVTAVHRTMEAVAHRTTEGEGALGKLQQLLTDLLVDNLWMMNVKPPFAEGSRRYYLTQKPVKDARSFKCLVGFDGKERVAKIVNDWIEGIDVAPQTKIAAKFKPRLFQDPGRIEWDTVMLDLVEQIRTQPDIDPLLQVALLRKVLESAFEGSQLLREALGDYRNLVDHADVNVNVPWMDPDNRDADRLRPKAAAFIRSLPDLSAARKQLTALRSRSDRRLAYRPQPIGWLAHESDGWRVRTGSVLPEAGSLWLVTPGEAGRGAWRKVGSLDQSRPRLAPADESALAEGRPVFVTPPARRIPDFRKPEEKRPQMTQMKDR